MNNMFNFDIGKPKEETVTLSYLKTLPMFGSVIWMDNERNQVRARALFRLNSYSKKEMLELFVELKEALLVETLPRSKMDNDSFCLKGVNVITE